MKYLIIILLLLTSCAWNKTDKSLLISYGILSALDAVQTSQIDGINQIEGNPLLSKDDGKPDMEKVVAVKVLSGLAVYFAADFFPKYRTPFLIGVTALQGGVVILNLRFNY